MSGAKDSIPSMLWRASRGPQLWVAGPETIEQMIKDGDKDVQEVKTPPVEEGLKALFDERLTAALAIADQLPVCPIYEPSLVDLYDDIRFSILFGMNGNAINLCGMLLEFVLKYVRFLKDHGEDETFNQEIWSDYIEKPMLNSAIEKARKEGFIDENIETRLKLFKDDVRNPYAHFNVQKITEHVVFGKTQVRNTKTGETTEEDVPASHSPVFQLIAKRKVDEHQVLKVFIFVDSVVHHVIARLFEMGKEGPDTTK
jgi:hypothetical protein